jgi:AcrR family transcriptional regulator
VTKPVEERRQEIIDTAQRLFKANGFDKTQVADISKAMNTAQGLVYHYFKSKTDILYAVIDAMAAEQSLKTSKILSQSDGSALEKMTLLFNTRPDFEDLDTLVSSLKSDRAVLEYCSNKMTASAMPVLLSLIESGNEDGSWTCEYPRETAVFILQGLSGLVELIYSSTKDDSRVKTFTNFIFRILDSGASPK